VHSVETNIGAFYAVRNSFPGGAAALRNFTRDADLRYLDGWTLDAANAYLEFTINATNATSPLAKLDNLVLRASAVTQDGKIVTWNLSGTLADELGLK
jgi:hypothetical protein